MLLLKLMVSPSKKSFPVITRNSYELCATSKALDVNKAGVVNSTLPQGEVRRLLHTTPINRDMEAALKSLASGVAATGVIGPGIGMGVIFGNMLNAVARNPSVSNKIFQYGVMGAAFCESIAFFALMISFIVII